MLRDREHGSEAQVARNTSGGGDSAWPLSGQENDRNGTGRGPQRRATGLWSHHESDKIAEKVTVLLWWLETSPA